MEIRRSAIGRHRSNLRVGLFVDLQNRVAEARNARGASAVEYGLLIALIAVVIIVAVEALGGNLQAIFQKTADELK